MRISRFTSFLLDGYMDLSFQFLSLFFLNLVENEFGATFFLNF